jgi:hypothetical protein
MKRKATLGTLMQQKKMLCIKYVTNEKKGNTLFIREYFMIVSNENTIMKIVKQFTQPN